MAVEDRQGDGVRVSASSTVVGDSSGVSGRSSKLTPSRRWRLAVKKLEAVKAFKDRIDSASPTVKKKYCLREVDRLYREVEGDVHDAVAKEMAHITIDDGDTASTNANLVETAGGGAVSPRARASGSEPRTDPNASQANGGSASPTGHVPASQSSKLSKSTSKFKAAANAIIFMGSAQKKVKFRGKKTRTFSKASSFWDHEFWDDDESEEFSKTSDSLNLNQSNDSSVSTTPRSSLAAAKECWITEFESKVQTMPSDLALKKACKALVANWVQNGHVPDNRSAKWMRKFGDLDPVDAIYHRIHRHPAVALQKLASLCERPQFYFLDGCDRQDIALLYLYEALALWDRQEDADRDWASFGGDASGRENTSSAFSASVASRSDSSVDQMDANGMPTHLYLKPKRGDKGKGKDAQGKGASSPRSRERGGNKRFTAFMNKVAALFTTSSAKH